MKRCVCITMDIDPTEYHKAKDTPEGAIKLAVAILRNDADLIGQVTVSCQGVTKIVKVG